MKDEFSKFDSNIRLTDTQEEDATKKYTGVCKTLHKAYYKSNYDGSTKYLFGSYKTKTNTRPLSEDQDVDVLFKIPEETYNRFKEHKTNGPSALLQEIKEKLKETYTTTDKIKAWGKIVLVAFSENKHNVEVLPAFENKDGSFIIPNSENDGSWDKFNPRKQVDSFQSSNSTTNGLTAIFVRMMKTWVKNTSSLNYKSYDLLSDSMKFLKKKHKNGANYSQYQNVVLDYFEYLEDNCGSSIASHVSTALSRSKNALKFIEKEQYEEASKEYRKIFGTEFPIAKNKSQNNAKSTSEQLIANEVRSFSNPSSPYVKN